MAKIRIIDEWLRAPISGPTSHRAIMVVADAWAEQRVLMRAYANSSDQTRPTIFLHGTELAIGPAGIDPHGPWGIHVQPPADGRAQELRGQLELAAKRLWGSKGNPPRLEDEADAFERKATNQWAPGTPPDVPRGTPTPYYEPAAAAAPQPAAPMPVAHGNPSPTVNPYWRAGPDNQSMRRTRSPRSRRGTARVEPGPDAAADSKAGRTQRFAPPPPRQSRILSVPAPPKPAAPLASVVKRTMPLGFRLTDVERLVVDALSKESPLLASQIAEICGEPDGATFMGQFIDKLTSHGLDLIIPGTHSSGEQSYSLRH